MKIIIGIKTNNTPFPVEKILLEITSIFKLTRFIIKNIHGLITNKIINIHKNNAIPADSGNKLPNSYEYCDM